MPSGKYDRSKLPQAKDPRKVHLLDFGEAFNTFCRTKPGWGSEALTTKNKAEVTCQKCQLFMNYERPKDE